MIEVLLIVLLIIAILFGPGLVLLFIEVIAERVSPLRPREDEAFHALKGQFELLRGRTYAQLAELPEHARLEEAEIGKEHLITLWKEELESGTLRVVVRSILSKPWRSAHIDTLGFDCTPNGATTDLRESVLRNLYDD